ncbi:MAG: hypothetical protein KatS3mg051_1832 [Anaerolineae bacterium]|nr:MAG: hypothetical protein KatS3mg051_1832 [Anaerolineae bacterium]
MILIRNGSAEYTISRFRTGFEVRGDGKVLLYAERIHTAGKHLCIIVRRHNIAHCFVFDTRDEAVRYLDGLLADIHDQVQPDI